MRSPFEEDDSTSRIEKLYHDDLIDESAFEQILSMDNPGDHEFSQSIVYDFFDQATETFVEIEDALGQKDLSRLSQRGHFLKGSSLTLGMNKVRDRCEVIQQYGKHENLDGSPEPDDNVCLQRISEAFVAVKVDVAVVEKLFRQFYEGDEASATTEGAPVAQIEEKKAPDYLTRATVTTTTTTKTTTTSVPSPAPCAQLKAPSASHFEQKRQS